ncbi:Serine/threonine-protein kinase AFC2 [Durusdinium trenchii]|uniref:Serine/threonine-protein kinase AFC2 n=1 Tax=Durusdinium trenchii TaxID=1381693 RepID=A0ABP0HYZ6_9DINO
MWCKMLSDASEIPIVVVTDSDRAEFDHPMLWLRSLVHEGDFGLETAAWKILHLQKHGVHSKSCATRSKGHRY